MPKLSLRPLIPERIKKLRHRWLRWQLEQGDRRAHRITDGRVIAGPFKGMKFVDNSDGNPLAPKLFGTYELELHQTINVILQSEHDLIVNIGAAEGYYAVGLLTQMPSTRVLAFEIIEKRRLLINKLARLNGVGEQIDVKGKATHESLQAALEGSVNPFVLCDIEGCERKLLNPIKVPALHQANILVEVHDFIDPSVSTTLRERFEASHELKVISSRERTVKDLSSTPYANDESMTTLISERRPCAMEWFWLKATKAPS